MKFLKSKIFDLAVVAVFFILAAAEGKAYPLAGICAILWLAVVAFRHYIKE
jgi:hypothetical protein